MAQARTNHITEMVKLAHSSEAASATRNPPAAISHTFRWVTELTTSLDCVALWPFRTSRA